MKFDTSDEYFLKSQIIQFVYKKVDEANDKFKLDLEYPVVDFFEKGTTGGLYYYREHKVSYNLVLAKENPETFYETVIHEVSHLVTRKLFPRAKQAHGPEFKRVDKKLGGVGTRCHNFDVSSVQKVRNLTRYVVECYCGIHYLTKKSYLNADRYHCSHCN